MTINAHPELPPFEYIRPASLTEASRFLAEHPEEARPLSGGTDIFVRMRDGQWRFKYLVDIKHFEHANLIRVDPHGGLVLGSGVNMNQVIASLDIQSYYPVLVQACRTVASYQLRTRATVVGNICNASPAGDTIGACLVLDGMLNIHGVDGYRKVHLAEFFLGPGKTILQPGDLVTGIHFPIPPAGAKGVYIKLGRNTWGDLSIVGVTAYGYPDSSLASGYRFKVALASVAPVPLLLTSIEAFLGANPVSAGEIDAAARLAQVTAVPIDDVRGSARYRQAMVYKLTQKALNEVWQNLRNTP